MIVGTRPEIIKMAPVIKELEYRGLDYIFLHSGQHYDFEMSSIFIEQLNLPKPLESIYLSSRSPGSLIGEMMIKLESALNKHGKVKITLIQGDTNTMLAAGLTSLKLGAKIGHVEAGLRSYDWRMPEEHNRRAIDHVSDYLFAPTESARRNLIDENAWGEIFVTGNTIIDSLDLYFDQISRVESSVLENIKFDEYALLTVHRSENVDDKAALKDIVTIISRSPIPIVFPAHPRTLRRLEEFNFLADLKELRNVQILQPQGYLEFLSLLKNCEIVLTDSGGVQEEITYPKIRKRALVLRKSTERPEAVTFGFARVVGTNPVVVLAELERALNEKVILPDKSPFGDGKAARRIVDVIQQKLEEVC
ncbi:MAG: UDP-N-acetylglucosamine 2-epimerase (non-hydrolyzing) [Ignisphaera sp.]